MLLFFIQNCSPYIALPLYKQVLQSLTARRSTTTHFLYLCSAYLLSLWLLLGCQALQLSVMHISLPLPLIWLILPPPHSWFSLNNLETVKTATLAFFSIQQHFIRDIRAKFGIPNFPQSSDIGQNLYRGISDIQISGESLIRVNFHNYRTSDDVGLTLDPATKLNKRKKTTSKKFYDNVMSANSNINLIFSIYG